MRIAGMVSSAIVGQHMAIGTMVSGTIVSGKMMSGARMYSAIARGPMTSATMSS